MQPTRRWILVELSCTCGFRRATVSPQLSPPPPDIHAVIPNPEIQSLSSYSSGLCATPRRR